MVKNQTEFDNSAKDLQNYELKLLKQIKALETIESTSKSVMDVYKSNIRNLNDVQNNQDVIIDELNAIENELDNVLPQY